MELQKQAEELLFNEKREYERISSSWKRFADGFYDEVLNRIKNGFSTSITRGDGGYNSNGGRTLSVGLSMNVNTDSAKAYILDAKQRIHDTTDEVAKHMSNLDKKMEEFRAGGIDSNTFKGLIDIFEKWSQFVTSMELKTGSEKITIDVDGNFHETLKKWKDFGNVEMRKKEAEKLGVELKDLDRHKVYLECKKQISNVSTTAAMREKIRRMETLSGYLDSDQILRDARVRLEELQRIEAEEKRRKDEEVRRKAEEARRAEEERKKREEAKREAEAAQYGISLSDLDTHKKYLRAKGEFEKAKTPEEFERSKSIFAQLKYLDSEDYVKKCDTSIEEITAAEKKKRSDKIAYLEYAAGLVSASMDGFAYVKPDGSVISHCKYSNIGGKGAPGDVSRFSNIKSVVCTQDGIVGLKYDGSCIATRPGFTYAYINECNSWRDIIAIAAGAHQVVGLRKNGTCVANSIKWNTGYGYDGQSDVSGWSNIISVACNDNFSMGLRSDGTVVLACTSQWCKVNSVTSWKNIEMIVAGRDAAAGLTKTGTIVSAGNVSTAGIDPKKGIVQLLIACGHLYALYMDGTVGGGGEKGSPRIRETNVISMTTVLRTIYVLTEDGKIHSYNHDSFSKVPTDIRIFDSYNKIMDDRIASEQKRAEEERIKAERKSQGVCLYCGGSFKKGLFSSKCISCGKKKDY